MNVILRARVISPFSVISQKLGCSSQASRYSYSSSSGPTSNSNPENYSGNRADYRKAIAPWMKFGQYEKGLLSHLSTNEILRALLVLRLCSFDYFVDKSTQLFNLSQRFGKLAEYVVRKTFYDQFIGGDEVFRMKKTVDLLDRRGITLMVCPVLEEDVDDEKSPMQVYNANLNSLKEVAQMASTMEKKENPLLLLKLTGIMPYKTLEVLNKVIWPKWEKPSELAKLVEELSTKNSEDLSILSGVSKEDKTHFINGIQRADDFINLTKRLGVKVIVDGEFYYNKYAISTISLVLMAKYNRGEYVVGDTIQAYLKDAFETIQTELEVVKLLNLSWYGKIVRGAYMDRERILAKMAGKPSPVWDSYEDTNKSYDRCVETVLRFVCDPSNKNSHLVVATHNEKSIRLAVETLKKLGIPPKNDVASFGQTYGMADYLSTPLVKNNYKVYKSTPYGPVAQAVPYIARRASENRSVLKGAREEIEMLRKELLSRMRLL